MPGALNVANIFGAIDDLEDGAEVEVQNKLTEALGEALLQLTEGLKFSTAVSDVTVVSTTDILSVFEGHLLFFNRIFVVQTLDEIDRGFYRKKLRKFVLFRLKSGLRLNAEDRFVLERAQTTLRSRLLSR